MGDATTCPVEMAYRRYEQACRGEGNYATRDALWQLYVEIRDRADHVCDRCRTPEKAARKQ